jgi:adenosylcobinamide kinase / adenosylcobinamide-phosphate guanylyltransferase
LPHATLERKHLGNAAENVESVKSLCGRVRLTNLSREVGFRKILVLGGARSGKSRFAERLAVECGEPVLYVATATAADEEMAERIARHRAQRPTTWRTLEASFDTASRAALEHGGAATVLVEDLTLLLSNLMVSETGGAEARATDELASLVALDAHVILVSNEVGMGVVPAYQLGRQFRDAAGRLNQTAAAVCSEVYLLVAGLPLRLK